MHKVDEYRRAITASHRFLVATCVAAFVVSLYLNRVNYLDVANAQLIELEEVESAPLSTEFTLFLRATVFPKLSASAKQKLGVNGSGPDTSEIVFENDPVMAAVPRADNENFGTISRLLNVDLPQAGLTFRTATLEQIREALGTYVFVPDLSAEKYLMPLERCIQQANFKSGSHHPFIIVRVFHRSPSDDLEIPGSENEQATVLVSPTAVGPRKCFNITSFSPRTVRDLVMAAFPSERAAAAVLPIYDFYPLPPKLRIGADLWEMLKDLTPSQALRQLRAMALSERPAIPAVGSSIPAVLLPVTIPVVILLLQLVLLRHARTALKIARENVQTIEWAWTGVYPDFLSRIITWVSVFAAPVLVTTLLWEESYRPVLGLSVYGLLRCLLLAAIGLSGACILLELREFPNKGHRR